MVQMPCCAISGVRNVSYAFGVLFKQIESKVRVLNYWNIFSLGRVRSVWHCSVEQSVASQAGLVDRRRESSGFWER